jgi:membrane fusion protein, multidrug efflux system
LQARENIDLPRGIESMKSGVTFCRLGHSIAVTLLVSTLTIFATTIAHAKSQAKAKQVAIEAITVSPSQLVETVSAIGTLRSNEGVIIRPEINGRVTEIGFEEGRPIKKGTVLFRLDSSVSRAELADAQAKLALSQRNYARAKKLATHGHTTTETLDKTLAEMRSAEARVKLFEARLEKTEILAPFDGIVGLRQVSIGDYVAAGKDLVNLENIDPIKVDFRLPERYLRVVRADGTVRITADALPGKTFEGKIYAIDPRIEPGGRSIAVRARLSNRHGLLRPGLFARVKLIIDHKLQAIVIPEEAVVRRGDQQIVFRVQDGLAVITPVVLGLRQTGRVEVVEGLKTGDVVVTAGHAKLREGAPVAIHSPVASND